VTITIPYTFRCTTPEGPVEVPDLSFAAAMALQSAYDARGLYGSSITPANEPYIPCVVIVL
jgi:hypothetical protein